MKKLSLISSLISGLLLLSSQPVMAGWLDSLKRGGKPVSTQEIELEPERYCIEFYQQGKFTKALLACSIAAKKDKSFYYYTAMMEYWGGLSNLELLITNLKEARQFLETKQDAESKQKLARVYFALATLYEKYDTREVWVVSDKLWFAIEKDKDYRDVARKYYEKALSLAEETNEKNIQAFALARLGAYYVDKSDLEKAEMYLQKAVKAWEETKETVEISKDRIEREKIELYHNLGKLAYKRKNYTEAEENFKKVLDIVRKCCTEELPGYWNWYGVWLYRMGKYDEAEEYIKKAIKTVERELKKLQERSYQEPKYKITDRLKNLAIWHENLAEIYIKKNNIAQAKESLLEANRKYKQIEIKELTAWDRLSIKRKIEWNEKKIRQLVEMNKQGEERR
jgi:tetratricopeptide (TPR) repeat protein